MIQMMQCDSNYAMIACDVMLARVAFLNCFYFQYLQQLQQINSSSLLRNSLLQYKSLTKPNSSFDNSLCQIQKMIYNK